MSDEEWLYYNTMWLDDHESIQHRLYEDFDRFFPEDKDGQEAKDFEDMVYSFCKVLFLLTKVVR